MEIRNLFPLISVLLQLELALCALDFQCLKCLCETSTQCVSETCHPETCREIKTTNYACACGPFAITPPFWMAANKPVLDDKGDTDAEKFKKCVETFPCSIWAIQYYMEKFATDCDFNKLINCDDYVLIHTYGPNKCRNSTLKGDRLTRYNTCMNRTEIIHLGSTVTPEEPKTEEVTANFIKREFDSMEDFHTIRPIEETESQIDDNQFDEEYTDMN